MTYDYRQADFRQRRANVDAAVIRAAREVHKSLPYDLRDSVDTFLAGVWLGSAPAIEQHTEALYEAYTPVRDLIRSRNGSRVTLYRGEPIDKPALHRRFLSWTPSWKMANHFATTRGHEIVEADVKTSDVVAVFVSPHNKGYVEYVVRDRKEYHVKPTEEQTPMTGLISVDRFGRDFGWEGPGSQGAFSAERVRAERPYLERALKAIGGALLSLNINEEDEGASATVVLPSNARTTVTRDGVTAVVGPYQATNLTPDPDVKWLPKGRAQRTLF